MAKDDVIEVEGTVVERYLKDARLVSFHTIHGIDRTSKGTESPMFTRIPECLG